MLLTNTRLDKLSAFRSISTARGMMQGSAVSYTAMVLRGERPQPLGIVEDEDRDDHGAVTGPKVLSSIELAAVAGKYTISTNLYFKLT